MPISARFRCHILLAASLLMASFAARAQTAPGYGFATDTNNQIVSINMASGQATVYAGTTLFPANALAYSDNFGLSGSVFYSSNNTVGQIGVWDRANNTHTDIGNIAATNRGFTNPYTGNALPDAVYWPGGQNLAAGYYVVSNNRNIYRTDILSSGGALAISNVTLVGTVPIAATNATLGNTFAFGDVAFGPNGLLYLSDSTNGFVTYNFATQTATRVSTRYNGQIAFGLDGKLYGVGALSGTGQGSDLFQIDPATGQAIAVASNTTGNSTVTYRDFSGAAALNVVPEPRTWVLMTSGASLLVGFGLRRRVMRE